MKQPAIAITTPIARTIVTTAASPSGIAATASDIDDKIASI